MKIKIKFKLRTNNAGIPSKTKVAVCDCMWLSSHCFIVFVNFQESQMMMMELRTVRRCFGIVASGMITSVMSN